MANSTTVKRTRIIPYPKRVPNPAVVTGWFTNALKASISGMRRDESKAFGLVE